MTWFKNKTKYELLLEGRLADTEAAHKQEMANLRADHSAALSGLRGDHAATVTLLKEQIQMLRTDLDATRLLLNPGLAVDRRDPAPPTELPEQERGTPWERVQKRILAEQAELAKKAVEAQKKQDADAALIQTGAKSGSS